VSLCNGINTTSEGEIDICCMSWILPPGTSRLDSLRTRDRSEVFGRFTTYVKDFRLTVLPGSRLFATRSLMTPFLVGKSLGFVRVDRAIGMFRRRIDRVQLQGLLPRTVDDVVLGSGGDDNR
jgi:hypothetical protein